MLLVSKAYRMGRTFLASLLLFCFLELRLSSSKKLGGHVCVRLPSESLLHTRDTSTARAREIARTQRETQYRPTEITQDETSRDPLIETRRNLNPT